LLAQQNGSSTGSWAHPSKAVSPDSPVPFLVYAGRFWVRFARPVKRRPCEMGGGFHWRATRREIARPILRLRDALSMEAAGACCIPPMGHRSPCLGQRICKLLIANNLLSADYSPFLLRLLFNDSWMRRKPEVSGFEVGQVRRPRQRLRPGNADV